MLRLIISGILMLAVLMLLRAGYEQYLLKNLATEVREGITQEFSGLTLQGSEAARDPGIVSALLAEDVIRLRAVLASEDAGQRDAAFIVADRTGAFVAHSRTASSTAEETLSASSIGQALIDEPAETSGFLANPYPPFATTMVTGQPILQEGLIVGYVLASRDLGSTYALTFLGRYLSNHSIRPEMAFSTSEGNIIASTFDEADISTIDRLEVQTGGAVAHIGNRTYRSVLIPLDGFEGQSVGVILFLPIIPLMYLISIALGCMFLAYPLTRFKRFQQ